MTDYGHELRFGTFLTPQNSSPDQVVDLAVLSEELGFDLVTFQDHPYQAGFLDTWTLLSFVAARTERIHLAPNVANLPLRPPAVLARSAASLDLLSGGRFELGLGAGGFWDAIEAMGGRRLTPGQGVDALSEAVDVIRGIWDADERRPLHVDGDFYEVHGARRGPRTPHPVGIWLGAYKPRMLRLTGAKADGWLPSLPYLQPGDLPRSNTTIDEAAEAAGRDPREVRRLLNVMGRLRPAGAGTGPDQQHGAGQIDGPVEHWVDELTRYVVEDGIGTLILGGDDPRDLARFAEEVAPAVREAVAAERASAGTATGPVRSRLALSRRVPGIDYDAIPAGLEGKTVEPGDREYPRLRSNYLRGGRPGVILLAETPDDVVDALAFARDQRERHGAVLSVRSAGHGISGRSTNDDGVLLDVSRMDAIEVLDEARRLVRVGPGATWGHVAAALAEHGWAMSSGDYGDVGVGGLATTGGVGLLGRKHGLTIDHVVAYDLVLADGTPVRASADENPDLFWAMRGAGGNFGVVTAVELEAYPVGDVVYGLFVYDASDPRSLLERWGRAVQDAPRELTSFLTLQPRAEQPVAFAMTMLLLDDDLPGAGPSAPDGAPTPQQLRAAEDALLPLLAAAPLLQQQAQVGPYAAFMTPQDAPHLAEGEGTFRGALVDRLDGEVADAFAAVVASGLSGFLSVRAVGGAVNDVPAGATAYPHRDGQQFSLSAVAYGDRARFDALWDATIVPLAHGTYLSFDTDQRPERLLEAFPEPALTRLRELKRRYDPTNLFDRNFPIPPAD